MPTVLDRKNLQKWIDALRAPENQKLQIRGELAHGLNEKNTVCGFCAIGLGLKVLGFANVMQDEEPNRWGIRPYRLVYTNAVKDYGTTDSACEILEEATGLLIDSVIHKIPALNDQRGMGFYEIAHVLEANAKRQETEEAAKQ